MDFVVSIQSTPSTAFLVNGQTGKVSGKSPISAVKVTITVLIAVIIVILVLFFADAF